MIYNAKIIAKILCGKIDWDRTKAVYNYYRLGFLMPDGTVDNWITSEAMKKNICDFVIATLEYASYKQIRYPYYVVHNHFELCITETTISLKFIPNQSLHIINE